MRLAAACVLSLSVLCSGVSTPVAHATSPVAVLVLPTQMSGNVPDRAAWQKAFDERIQAVVRKSGRSTHPSGPLTASEAGCRDATCMAATTSGGISEPVSAV